jgi:hypothetical protein
MLKQLRKYDEYYSALFGIFNPYSDAFDYKLSRNIPAFDKTAYDMHEKYRFVYDKLFIAKSQGVRSGTFKEFDGQFPIFIKPRNGHETSSSKNCYKIYSQQELDKYTHLPDMMWSEFINHTEGMTDFVLLNGKIVYQMTYQYSDEQYGFADVWKYISIDNKPPEKVVKWVNQHMVDYTGPLNIQYRSDIIIEVGMRFARSGIYIESTDNKYIVDNINHLWHNKEWKTINEQKISFKPYYSFKCWSPVPVFYLIPQHILDLIMTSVGAKRFYEYYFEPTGKTSVVFFQFLHEDFNVGMQTKKLIEMLMNGIQLLIVCLFITAIILFGLNYKLYAIYIFTIIGGIMLTSLINSLNVIYSQIVNQKQFYSFF